VPKANVAACAGEALKSAKTQPEEHTAAEAKTQAMFCPRLEDRFTSIRAH
jgi:hypothetical protein